MSSRHCSEKRPRCPLTVLIEEAWKEEGAGVGLFISPYHCVQFEQVLYSDTVQSVPVATQHKPSKALIQMQRSKTEMSDSLCAEVLSVCQYLSDLISTLSIYFIPF